MKYQRLEQAQAAKRRDQALAEVQHERERILGDLRGQVAALSVAVAQKLIGETLVPDRQHDLINEFFSGRAQRAGAGCRRHQYGRWLC